MGQTSGGSDERNFEKINSRVPCCRRSGCTPQPIQRKSPIPDLQFFAKMEWIPDLQFFATMELRGLRKGFPKPNHTGSCSTTASRRTANNPVFQFDRPGLWHRLYTTDRYCCISCWYALATAFALSAKSSPLPA